MRGICQDEYFRVDKTLEKVYREGVKTLFLTLFLLPIQAFSLSETQAYEALSKHIKALSWHDTEGSTVVEPGDRESFRFSSSGDPNCINVLGWYQERLHVYDDSQIRVSCRNFKASVCKSKVSLHWADLADCE